MQLTKANQCLCVSCDGDDQVTSLKVQVQARASGAGEDETAETSL